MICGIWRKKFADERKGGMRKRERERIHGEVGRKTGRVISINKEGKRYSGREKNSPREKEKDKKKRGRGNQTEKQRNFKNRRENEATVK